MKKATVRVLCVDDHAFLVEGLRARLELESSIEFVGRLETADHLVEEVERTGADIVLLDIEMPGRDSFEALRDLANRYFHVKAIMLSAYIRDHYIDSAVDAGAWGYLSKSDEPDTIVAAIRRVARGEFAFSPVVEERFKRQERRSAKAEDRPLSKFDSLTPREVEILRLIGKGMSRSEIAKAVFRSPKTIDAHRISIMNKLDIHDRVELARFAIREGLVEP